MSNITVPPIPTNSPNIPASAIAASNAEFAQFLETLMTTKQRGHRQADPAEVSLAKLKLWTRELFRLRASKTITRDEKKRIHTIRQNISRTSKKHPLLLKALAQQEVTR